MSEKKTTVYFAHPFVKWISGSKRERMIEKILTERGYEVINPFEFEDHLCDKYGVEFYYQAPYDEFAKDIVEADYKRVRECDELFAWIPKNTRVFGTICEIVYADSIGKKITALHYSPNPFLNRYADVLYLGYNNFKENKPYNWVKFKDALHQ